MKDMLDQYLHESDQVRQCQWYQPVSGCCKLAKGIFFWGEFVFAILNTLADNKILDWSKLKQIADDIFNVHSE